MDVVIPDELDGLPVTRFGTIFSPGPEHEGTAITSVSGGRFITTIMGTAFLHCTVLTSVSLPSVTSIGEYAFYDCWALTSVTLPSVTSIEDSAFAECATLGSVSLPLVTTVGESAFANCLSLNSVLFGKDAPAEALDVYINDNSVINYVTNPQATGWGAMWNGRPVVRLPLYGNGANLIGITAAQVAIAETVGTYDNASPISIIFTNWNQSYSATITSTGVVTIALGASGSGVENWMNLNICATGSPSFTWPAQMWHFAQGVGSSNAPAPSKYGRVEIVTNSLSFFSCQAWTNVPFGGR
jgi:hypothetical protein